jgi:hypothetical protein
MHAIDHPEELEAARRAWIEFLVKTPLDEASQRCVDAIQKITGK